MVRAGTCFAWSDISTFIEKSRAHHRASLIFHNWFANLRVCSSHYKRQFVSTNTNSFSKPVSALTSNPGIVSEITKRQKNAAAQ